jgi:hypothetical protein
LVDSMHHQKCKMRARCKCTKFHHLSIASPPSRSHLAPTVKCSQNTRSTFACAALTLGLPQQALAHVIDVDLYLHLPSADVISSPCDHRDPRNDHLGEIHVGYYFLRDTRRFCDPWSVGIVNWYVGELWGSGVMCGEKNLGHFDAMLLLFTRLESLVVVLSCVGWITCSGGDYESGVGN